MYIACTLNHKIMNNSQMNQCTSHTVTTTEMIKALALYISQT